VVRSVALDARSTSVRELFRQIQADRFKTANPKLDIKAKLHDSAAAPVAKFHFVDGTEVRYILSQSGWAWFEYISFANVDPSIRKSLKDITTIAAKSCTVST
jgi:hypothetical protein